jgi:hypothetical protein
MPLCGHIAKMWSCSHIADMWGRSHIAGMCGCSRGSSGELEALHSMSAGYLRMTQVGGGGYTACGNEIWSCRTRLDAHPGVPWACLGQCSGRSRVVRELSLKHNMLQQLQVTHIYHIRIPVRVKVGCCRSLLFVVKFTCGRLFTNQCKSPFRKLVPLAYINNDF